MRRRVLWFVVLVALSVPCGFAQGDGERLHALFAREWEWRLAEDPLLATEVGRGEYDHLLPDVSVEAVRRRAETTRAFLAELDGIGVSSLSRLDQVSAAIFRRQLTDRIANFEFGAHEIPLTYIDGFHLTFAYLPRQMSFETAAHFDNYLTRLEGYPRYVAQQIIHLRSGLRRGMTLPRAILEGVEAGIAAHVVETPEESVFWTPLERFPEGIPDADRDRLRARARKAILEGAVAGYRSFLTFMREEYLPGARMSLGASALPGGELYYAHLVRSFTTLEVTPEEVHETGLREVARIQAEMEATLDTLGFHGSFADFLHFLRTDPRFYAETPEALLREAAWIAKRMDGKLPSLFGRLPRRPYTVVPTPDHLAPTSTGGRYVPPAGEEQPGTYWVNTYNLPARPLYTLEALTLHEAVPGHHLEFALGEEMERLPPFRRYAYLVAFSEGWGLYAERLGLEAGFYRDPYSNFGRLTYEMWRACRLVVDTGLHAMGWTRDQARDYLASHTALSLHEVATETDRYISWPGQALAYKMGELKIRELRRRAEGRLGARFDVRAFHDVVLGDGSVPLPVLEENVDRWIAETAAGK